MNRFWLRRLIHASSAVLLLFSVHSWEAVRVAAVVALVAGAALEAVRLHHPPTDKVVRRFIPVFRDSEHRRVNGAVWLAAGYSVASLFPAGPGTLGILAGALADPAGSAVGLHFGDPGRKTVVGSVAVFAVVGVIGIVVGTGVEILLGCALAAALVERFATSVDDNLVLSPAVAAVAWLLA